MCSRLASFLLGEALPTCQMKKRDSLIPQGPPNIPTCIFSLISKAGVSNRTFIGGCHDKGPSFHRCQGKPQLDECTWLLSLLSSSSSAGPGGWSREPPPASPVQVLPELCPLGVSSLLLTHVPRSSACPEQGTSFYVSHQHLILVLGSHQGHKLPM